MSLTRSLPFAALDVVNLIRRDTTRPDCLPVMFYCSNIHSQHMRWLDDKRWVGFACCPMGFLPGAMTPTPIDQDGLKADLSAEAMETFAFWWDEQTDAQAAVDAVWGEP